MFYNLGFVYYCFQFGCFVWVMVVLVRWYLYILIFSDQIRGQPCPWCYFRRSSTAILGSSHLLWKNGPPSILVQKVISPKLHKCPAWTHAASKLLHQHHPWGVMGYNFFLLFWGAIFYQRVEYLWWSTLVVSFTFLFFLSTLPDLIILAYWSPFLVVELFEVSASRSFYNVLYCTWYLANGLGSFQWFNL